MSLQSPCAITFTPEGGTAIVLCAVGGWLSTPPLWEVEQDVFESDGVDAGEAHFAPLGGVKVILSFGIEEDHATLAAALDGFSRCEMQDGVNLLRVGGALEISSSAQTTRYDPAVIRTIRPELPSGAAHTLTRTFTIHTTLPTIPGGPS